MILMEILELSTSNYLGLALKSIQIIVIIEFLLPILEEWSLHQIFRLCLHHKLNQKDKFIVISNSRSSLQNF